MYGKKHTDETRKKISDAIEKIKHLKKKRVFPENYSDLMRDKLGKGKYFNCLKCGKEYYVPLRRIKASIGIKYCSRKCTGHAIAKEKNPRWNGGKTHPNRAFRSNPEYKLWRESVFKRDAYTCKFCGARSSNGKTVYLQAHHIKPFALYPEHRLDINNGVTLCLPCHKKTDSYLVNVLKSAREGKA